MSDKIIRVKIDAGDSKAQIDQLDKSMVQAGVHADKLNDELLGLSGTFNTKLTPTAAAVSQALNTAGGESATFGRKAGQAAVQVEQLVGQITAGGNPMQAFAFQAADLGIVLGAPLLGAIVGVSAALASVLLPSLIGGKTEVEKLDEALKNLKETSGTTEDGIYVLNEQIVKLAQVSAAAAQVKLAANIFEAEAAARQAAGALEEVFDAGRLQLAVDTYSSGVSGLVGVSNEVTGISRRIGQEFGLQGQAAINFGADVAIAIGKIQKAPTPEAFDNLTNLIASQALKAGTKSATELAGSLLDVALKGRQAAEEIERGKNAVNNLSEALKKSEGATSGATNNFEQLEKSLKLQAIALKDGELKALLQAAAWQTGAKSIDKLDPKIKDLIESNYKLEESQKYLKQAQSDLNSEIDKQAAADSKNAAEDARKAERATRERERINQRIADIRLETQTLASEAMLQKAVRDEIFTQEEADLAAQTSARLLAASTEYQQLMALSNINDEQKIQAEIAFQEQILSINDQYDQARLALKKRVWMQEISAQQSAANAGIQLIAAFGSKSFQAQKNASIATSIVNIAGGVAKALNNPYPANLGFAAQVAAEGAALISTIKSTNIGSGGGSSVSVSAGSATLPTTPQAAPTVGAFEIAGISDLTAQLSRLDNDDVLPVAFTKRLVASLESVQRLQGA